MATILVADSEPAIRDRLRGELVRRGFEVVHASNGDEACAALDAYELDVVLSDLRIAGIDGAPLSRWKQLAPDTEVVVGAAHDDLASAIVCVNGGAFDYVAKPYKIGEVLTTLERALERRQLRAASALYASSRVILAAREPDRLPEVIVGVALKAMHADDVALMVPGDDGKLHVACSTAIDDDVRRQVNDWLQAFVHQVAVGMREPLVMACGDVQSCILFPLCSGDRMVGLLQISRVLNRRRFGRPDLDKATVLASQILLALENMRLVRQTISAERMATVGQVATSIAHEINNPIAYVLASQTHVREQLGHVIELCGLIDSGADTSALRARYARAGGRAFLSELSQAVDDVRDGAERVRDILRDTRALAGNQDAAITFDIAEAIRSALRIVAAEIRHKAVVSTSLADGVFVHGVIGRLSQVFVNLLVRAADAFQDGPVNSISITSRLDGANVVITVCDNGPGIAPTHVPRLFDPFFPTNLAIARDVVRAHGGEISVESEPGSTTFTIVLQRALPRRPKAQSTPPLAAAAVRLRILFIDDEPNILRAYKRAVGPRHDVVLASDGTEALAAIAARPDFDLVICDLSMPTMSGMQVYDHVRSHAPGLADRFVFATGGATQRHLEEFLASVPNRVLEKPFEMRVLRELIADLQGAS